MIFGFTFLSEAVDVKFLEEKLYFNAPFRYLTKVNVGIFSNSFYFGTSVRRSSWSAFGRPTGNDVSGH